MPKISVIVPVYNVENTIGKCLDSIVNQTLKDIEIIVVNDGSKDKSQDIIDEYAKKYSNIKSYIKENGGLSDARNYGLEKASGDYICFVDSDDYINTSLFEKLEKYILLQIDMIKYKMIKVDENYKEIEKIDGPTFDELMGEDAFNTLYSTDIMLQPAWLYLYKKSFLDENNFKYPVGKYHEDFATTVLLMVKAKSIVSTDIYGYYYYQSNESITRGNDKEKTLKRAMDMLEHYTAMEEEIKNIDLAKKTKENIKIYYTNNIILKVEELEGEDRKLYIKEIKRRKMLKNIKARNLKQLLKKLLLNININWYLKLR